MDLKPIKLTKDGSYDYPAQMREVTIGILERGESKLLDSVESASKISSRFTDIDICEAEAINESYK
jgi:hypothetical protein